MLKKAAELLLLNNYALSRMMALLLLVLPQAHLSAPHSLPFHYHSHTKSPQTNNNGSLVNLVLQWPGSVYRSDLLQGFQKMDLVKIGSTEDQFKQAFSGIRFVH